MAKLIVIIEKDKWWWITEFRWLRFHKTRFREIYFLLDKIPQWTLFLFNDPLFVLLFIYLYFSGNIIILFLYRIIFLCWNILKLNEWCIVCMCAYMFWVYISVRGCVCMRVRVHVRMCVFVIFVCFPSLLLDSLVCLQLWNLGIC